MLPNTQRRRLRSERGAATLETVVVWPAVFLIFLTILHAGFWFHARNIAIGAAQEGARVASAQSRGDGAARAAEFISDAGGDDVLTVTDIRQTETADTVTVTVTGYSESFVPGLEISVTQSSTAPLKGWID